MSGKQKQSKLGKFGFTRSIKHRGEKMNMEIPEFVIKIPLLSEYATSWAKQASSNSFL